MGFIIRNLYMYVVEIFRYTSIYNNSIKIIRKRDMNIVA